MKRVLWVAVAWMVAACANPLDTPLPREIDKMETIKPVVDKLKPEERDLLAGYVLRQAVGAKLGGLFGIPASAGIPEGMTLGKAIADQKKFLEEHRLKEAAEKAASEKEVAQRQALADEFAKVVDVRLIKVDLHEATFRDSDVQSYLSYVLEIQNKGAKDVTGLKGTMTIRDTFGDVISTRGIKSESKVAAGATSRVTLSREYSKFSADDRKEASIDAAKAKAAFAPTLVLFADGTRFEAAALK